MNVIRVVSEIILLLKETNRGIVIPVAGHNEKVDAVSGCLGYIFYVVYEAFKDVEITGYSDIIHAFGRIGTETRSHSAGKQHSGNMP